MQRQLEAIERFNRNLRMSEQAAEASARSREMRMDAARRMEVLRRQQQAVVDRAQQHLEASGGLLGRAVSGRAVLAHRNEWFLDKVSAVLREHGLEVVGRMDNGADAVGLAVCEQPDLVLVEDTLAMLPGVEVVRELRDLCPQARIVAQCGYSDGVGELLDAGATAVYTRRIPPAEVATAMCQLIA